MELILTLSSEAVSAALTMAELEGIEPSELIEDLIREASVPAEEGSEDEE